MLCLMRVLCGVICTILQVPEEVRSPEARVTGVMSHLSGCWELNLGPLEQCVLLISEPFSQS